jgi:hypothetical protein
MGDCNAFLPLIITSLRRAEAMSESIVSEKRCCGCQITKPASDFHKWNRSADGLAHYCKLCKKAKWKPKVYPISVESGLCIKCNQTKPALEMVRKENKPSGIGNTCLECFSAYSAEKYKANPEPARERAKAWHNDNKEKALAAGRIRGIAWYQANKEKSKAQSDKWRKDNPERFRELLAKRRERPKHRIRDRIAQSIRNAIHTQKAGRSWESLVGYTLEDLVKRLKKTLPKGVSFEQAMAEKYHIDHIIPVSAFNFSSTDDIDFKKCWSLSNLRSLPASENCSKGAKIEKPFQPSLTGL